MAKPIGATPVLTGQEAISFLIQMDKLSREPVGPIPTPRLSEAEKLIERSAKRQQK